MQCQAKFLSTLSLRRATSPAAGKRAGCHHFYPRSPCGERPITDIDFRIIAKISIHALLAESDGRRPGGPFRLMLFLSTLSLRRATKEVEKLSRVTVISIHALLAESDILQRHLTLSNNHFYPRSPCGERLPGAVTSPAVIRFLSTLSLRRATPRNCPVWSPRRYFYPRSPCGERLPADLQIRAALNISIHALLAESDGGSGVGSWPHVIFLSTLSLRRATTEKG